MLMMSLANIASASSLKFLFWGGASSAVEAEVPYTNSGPSDYQHYWHPSLYADGTDRGSSTTPLNATDLSGTVSITTNEFLFPYNESAANGITLASAITNRTAYTIAFWAAEQGGGSSGGYVLNTKGVTYSNYEVLYSTNSNWVFRVYNTFVQSQAVTAAPPSSAWHHVACSVGAAGLRMYVSGTLVTNVAYSGTPETTTLNSTTLGNRGTGAAQNYAYTGRLDKVQFFPRQLSDAEVSNLAADRRNR